MTADSVALVGALCHKYRDLMPVLSEHLKDNEGEVLPHLVMSDIVRWLVQHRDNAPFCQEVWSWLENAFEQGSDDEKDVIGVSAVEMIPDPGEPGSEFRAMLGKDLSAIDPWLSR